MIDTITNPEVQTITCTGSLENGFDRIISTDALDFLLALQQNFNARRKELLQKRTEKQQAIDQGIMPDFLTETRHIRESEWTVAPLPADLIERRVEITGPVDRKMVINALNSGANVFMADFEDSNSPNWFNTIQGQINLRDAINGTIEFTKPDNSKTYSLNENIAVLMVRPRGWHLEEKHLLIDAEPMSASLVDFGLFFFHNAKQLIQKGSGPYFYLPKLENHLEARLWNDVFVFAQDYLKIPQKTIKATVLIETILASFEMHEILYELRDHSAGLNCGRWDYIFSYIKKFRNLEGFTLPDRGEVTMNTPFMSAYSKLVIQTCHKRNVHAMGGMAAFIPIKNDAAANQKAIDKVIQDKMTEVKNGHDGTWVAHPALVQVAKDVFDTHMKGKNQITNKRLDVSVSAQQLVKVPTGDITEEGVRQNIKVGILYMESWLRGVGAAAIFNLMEDAATAEISRSQLWQWIQNKASLHDGRQINLQLYKQLLAEEIEVIKEIAGPAYSTGKFEKAIELFDQLVTQKDFVDFLTLPAYEEIK